MHPVANHLVQLQELALAREEQKVSGRRGEHLEQLDASIRALTAQLPQEFRVHVLKLQKRDPVVIVPVSDSICAGCGISLAISHIQSVRLEREVHLCPNCARYLYYPQAPARRLGRPARRMEPRKIGIARFSSPLLMIPALASDTMEGAIRELAARMEETGFIENAPKLVEDALRREAIASTALEHGLAFPHVRSVEGGGLTLAMGVSHPGFHAAPDGHSLTRFVFFIVIPTAASAFYLKLLAGLSETFMKPDARKTLLAEREPDKLWKALVKATRATIK